jgi:hypothetical protein
MKKIFFLLIFLVNVVNLGAQFAGNDSVPVRISYLQGERKNNNSNELDWAVSCSLQFAKFEIQRSVNAVDYYTIHTFQADELRCRQPFSYSEIQNFDKSFYRIKVGDIDGRFYSSKTIVLYGKNSGFDLVSIFPSITAGKTSLVVSTATTDKIEIVITSITGTVIKKINQSIVKGSNTIPVDLSSCLKGSYLISVSNGKGAVKTGRIIVN